MNNFKVGDLAKSKLTGEIVVIVQTYINVDWVRIRTSAGFEYDVITKAIRHVDTH